MVWGAASWTPCGMSSSGSAGTIPRPHVFLGNCRIFEFSLDSKNIKQ